MAGAVAPIAGPILTAGQLARLGRWIRRQGPHFSADMQEQGFRYDKREVLFRHVLEDVIGDAPIDYLEFGVARGASFRWWVEHHGHPESRFVGFDVFTGLPEDFGPVRAGTFDTSGEAPDVADARARFVNGYFQDTLGPFMSASDMDARPPGRRRLIVHMDADLYSSTLFVLTRLAPALRAGDVILFDEFGVPMHEFRAWSDFVSAYRVEATLLGQANDFLQAAFRVESIAR